jgi:hypothetical protein
MARKHQKFEMMTPEEERAYWDARDPLLHGKKVQIQHPEPPEGRLSYFALRLSGGDISRLADAAKARGMRPSELARLFIKQGLEEKETQEDLVDMMSGLRVSIEEVKSLQRRSEEKLSEILTANTPERR